MKNFFRIAAIFLAFGLVAAFAGCSNASGGGDAPAPAPAPTYTVTFNSNGGSDVASQTVTSGQTASKPADPTKEHFKFVEWCSDQACQTAFDFATPIKNDTILYAKWESVTYTVTFEYNNGSEAQTQSVESGQTAVKPADPTKDHFNFAGWCSDAECQTAFDFATPIVGDTNLYAKWSDLPVYIVTFDLNGGKYGSSDTYTQNIEDGSKAMRPASDPTKDDNIGADVTTKYAFDNWYADAGCGTLFDFDATTISGPTTVYAKWSETKYYTVTFELNGGKYGSSGAYTQSVLNGSKVTRPASNPTKDDSVSGDVTTKYAFDNWYADSGCGTLFDFNTMTISGLTTVYAKWNETKYYSITIASGIEYGSVSSDATESVAAGTLVTLAAAPNSGYDLSSYTVTDADSNIVTVVDGKFEMPASPVTVTATFSPIPLTFEAIEPNTVITFNNKASGSVRYRVNGGNLVNLSENWGRVKLENVGDKVCFYGNNATYTSGNYSSNIACDKDCYIYGNIMSLVDGENYENARELTDTYTFQELFYKNTHIKSKPGVDLALPATKLAKSCYDSMFNGCTSLTRAPDLPATSLAQECYRGMFYGCTSLASAPDLPVTELADGCYRGMFQRCTSLTSAPDLPATSLAWECYRGMFYGCTSLTRAPDLPATSLDTYCYSGMFDGCTSLASAPDLPATSLASHCYGGMFSGCTSLARAPDLPATSLASDCYSSMFSGCTSLASAPDLPATKLAKSCYSSMFKGCTSLASAPDLPATKLAEKCYCYMFADCTSLARAPDLPVTELAEGCYGGMFSGCTSLASAPDLPATKLAKSCYGSMFSGCTSLTSADLPATELAEGCYSSMFRGCTSLTAAPDLPATKLAKSCYRYMFADCTSLINGPILHAETLTEDCYAYMFQGCKNIISVTCLATDHSADNCTLQWLAESNFKSGCVFIRAAGVSWRLGTPDEVPHPWGIVDYQE